MTDEDKAKRLNAYPFYASSAMMAYFMRMGWDEDGMDGNSAKTADAEVAAAAKSFDEKQLNFMRVVVLHAEREAEARMAGVLSGMTPKARDEWIKRKAGECGLIGQ